MIFVVNAHKKESLLLFFFIKISIISYKNDLFISYVLKTVYKKYLLTVLFKKTFFFRVKSVK